VVIRCAIYLTGAATPALISLGIGLHKQLMQTHKENTTSGNNRVLLCMASSQFEQVHAITGAHFSGKQ
jgi:hypothetical protein